MADAVHHERSTRGASTEVRFVAVERDVAGLKTDISEIKSTMNVGFEKINTAIAGKGTNWSAVGLVVAAFFTISGWGFALFNSYQGRNEAAIKEQKEISAKFMDRADITGLVKAQGDAVASLFAATEKTADVQRTYQARITELNEKISSKSVDAIAKDNAEIHETLKQMVPLPTHQELWADQRKANDDLRRFTEENRRLLFDLQSKMYSLNRGGKSE